MATSSDASARRIALVTAGDLLARGRAFVAAFGRRAFRRPLSDAEVTRYAALFALGPTVHTGVDPFAAGVRLVVTAMLQEQGFNVKLTVMEVAAWLDRIYLKKDSIPEDHMCDTGWSTGSPEPDMVLTPIFSKALFSAFHDPEIDDALMAERQVQPPPAAAPRSSRCSSRAAPTTRRRPPPWRWWKRS